MTSSFYLGLVRYKIKEATLSLSTMVIPLWNACKSWLLTNYFLGSLVARIVLQPIEEILRVYFSKTLSSPKDITRIFTTHRDDTVYPSHNLLQQAADVLVSLLAIQLSIGVILVTFGSAYISIVLHILLPPRFLSTSAPSVLTAWIWYIPVLAVNGGLEAFVSSVAAPEDLNRQSW